MSSITLNNIRKVYPHIDGRRKRTGNPSGESKSNENGTVAVHNLSIKIKDQEFIVLVGPSGCGKSTTLRMIAGLEEITGGELYIDNALVNELEPKDRDIAMVFQNYALYPHMTVYDNMAFSLRRKIKRKEDIDAKVMEAAEILGITEYLDRKPKNLSGGQKQRVAIGRAIVRSPKVMLLDEPLSNLDAKLRNQMRAELIRLRKRIRTTFIYVTHDQTEAMTLGDRVIVMKDGYAQQIGTPQEIFDQPANKFVAGFIGLPQMNFFDSRLERRQGTYTVRLDEFEIPVCKEMAEIMLENKVDSVDIVLGVRPDDIITTGNVGPVAKIGVAELMGNSVHLHLDYKGKDVIAVTQARNDSNRLKTDYETDSTIHFSFLPESIHVFDRKTGENLGISRTRENKENQDGT